MAVTVVEFSRSLFEESGCLVAVGGLQLLPTHEILHKLGIDIFLVLFIGAIGDIAIGLLVDGQLID